MTRKKRVGRPKKKGPLRTRVLPIRLTESEHRLVDRAAKAADIPRGVWVRMVVLQKVRRDTRKERGS